MVLIGCEEREVRDFIEDDENRMRFYCESDENMEDDENRVRFYCERSEKAEKVRSESCENGRK
jgi:hypothetical protein